MHRGDIFLFAFCALEFHDQLMKEIAEQWFALITTLLLMDDAEDIERDIRNGDENAFLESGLTEAGNAKFRRIGNERDLQQLQHINQAMAMQLKEQYQ